MISGQALVPHTGGLNVSWVARALSGSPFSLTNGNVDPDRNGTQAEPLPVADYVGVGTDPYELKNYQARRNGAYGPGFFNADARLGYRFALPNSRRVEAFVDVFNMTNHTNFANPGGNQAAADDVPGADGVQHELRAEEGADRRAVRVLASA